MKLSSKIKTMIPQGVATLLPEGSSCRRTIEKEILSSFSSWGYQEVIPPIFEYLDVFSRGVGEGLLDSAYKFVDRATGRIMVLRPDVTPQIARIAATLLKGQSRPLRLCYSANVFRHQEEHAGRERELFQIGGELIGLSGAEADAEMISLAIEILLKLGLKDFRITLGQMAFTRGLLSRFESSPLFFNKILQHVAKKEVSSLEKCLKEEAVSENICSEVLCLLDLFGGEEVIKRASGLSNHPSCHTGLERLQDVYDILKAGGYRDYLLIDLGEVRGFDYYTGTIFEIFADGVGAELGGGGRYDDLLGKFGAASDSTGFALYIERIQEALASASVNVSCQPSVDLIVLHTAERRKEAMTLTQTLRDMGRRVIRKSGDETACARPFLEEVRSQKIQKVLVLEGNTPHAPLRFIDVTTGREEIQNQSDILGCLKSEWLKPQ